MGIADSFHFSRGEKKYSQALAELQKNNIQAAYPLLLETIRIDATMGEAWDNLATILKLEKKYIAALICARKAVAIKSSLAAFQLNLGDILFQMQRYEDAKFHLQKALSLDSRAALAWFNLTHIYLDEGNFEQALTYADNVVKLLPGQWEAMSLKALALLASGNFDDGWKESEVRNLNSTNNSFPAFSFPKWQGENLKNKRLYLYSEQGFGDTIQFVRYIQALPSEIERVIVEIPPALCRLFQISFPDRRYQFIAKGEPRPVADYHLPLLSLPAVLGSKANFAELGRNAYLQAPVETTLVNRAKGTRLAIGICWAGNPQHPNDISRSASIQEFCDRLYHPEVELFSLQPPNTGHIDPSLLGPMGVVQDLSVSINDFADTAALMKQLDCIVTVDTSVAHLAGALGCHAFVLLPYYGIDWRWGRGDKLNPWYPSLQFYRREAHHKSWQPLLDQVWSDISTHYFPKSKA